MSPTFDRVPAAQLTGRFEPLTHEGSRSISVIVVFTSVESTISALKKAAALASQLGARITLLVPQIVPYPLPITSPPILRDFNEKRFRIIASASPVETKVQICLCRDRMEAVLKVLSPRSLVVIGGRKRWWPTAEKKLGRHLSCAGHEVIMVETE